MDHIIAGKDIVATYVIAARVMGFEPIEISHIRRAFENEKA